MRRVRSRAKVSIYLSFGIIMFCCTRRENHGGEVVVGVCLESNCVDSGNQLACVQCLQEEHKGHTTSSMRKILPDLLSAHSRNLASER